MTVRRGWCPTLHTPMPSGDGLLLRVNARSGRLDAGALRLLARLSARYGNGMIELTRRARLQFRGFDEAGAAAFAAAVVEAGLGAADADAERLRGCIVSPLAGLDPGCAPGTIALAEALERAMLAETAVFLGLPNKFGITVDGGGSLPLGMVDAGLALRFRTGWGLEFDGRRAEASAGQLVETATALLRAVVAYGGGDPFAAAEIIARPTAVENDAGIGPTIGPLPFGAFGIGVPTGWLDHRRLSALADAVDAGMDAGGDGTVRLTPWRSVVVTGWIPDETGLLSEAVVDPADPRRRVAACVGAPRCRTGSMPAAAVVPLLARELPPGAVLHVSGCSKGCAHPDPATMVLVGHENGYDVVRNGRAADAAAVRGLHLEAAAALVRQAA